MIKTILFAAIAIASLITAPAIMGVPVTAQNQTSANGGTDTTDGTTTNGGTDTTDGTTTNGGANATDGTTTDGNLTATTKYYKHVYTTSTTPSGDTHWECKGSSHTWHVPITKIDFGVKRSSTPSAADDSTLGTSNWKGSLDVYSGSYVKRVSNTVSGEDSTITGFAHKKGSNPGQFKFSGEISHDNLCKAPHVETGLNLTSTELDEVSEVGATMVFGGANRGAATCSGSDLHVYKNKGDSGHDFGDLKRVCSTTSSD